MSRKSGKNVPSLDDLRVEVAVAARPQPMKHSELPRMGRNEENKRGLSPFISVPFYFARRVKNADRKSKGIQEIKRLLWSM